MTDTTDQRRHERTAVERAREGHHDAFVQLYRQDAPTAWHLALALTHEPAPAADAVAEAFRRVLAPTVTAPVTTDVPFRLQLLAAVRHAVLDARSTDAGHADVVVEQPGPANALPHLSDESVAAMAALHQLPERWRSALWLITVEGLGSDDVARVLGIRPQEAEDLAERARDGLRQQLEGSDATVADPDGDPTRHFAPLVPLPITLFDQAGRRWRAGLDRPTGPLGLTLPGGRPLPVWAERTLVGATGLLIALGITGALLSDSDGATSDDDDGQLARRREPAAAGDSMVVVDEPRAYLDGDSGDATTTDGQRGATTTTTIVLLDPTTGQIVGFVTADPTPAAADEPPPTTTTTAPLLQVNAGVGPVLGLAVGTQCGGVELLGTVIGCDPPTKEQGVSVDGSSRLLGG